MFITLPVFLEGTVSISFCFNLVFILSNKGELKYPNDMTFEVILYLPYSLERHFDKDLKLDLDEEYNAKPISPFDALVDVMKINLP